MPTIPRLPLVPDPLRRVRVPRDLEPITSIGDEVDPGEAGMTEKNVERIWKSAVDLFRSGVHPALQICVRRNGHVVLDRALGHSHGNGPVDSPEAEKTLATTGTPFVVYSASKAVTAFVVHMLIDRGSIDIDAPIAEYIPDYDRHDKGGITVGHVLAHRSGVPNLPAEARDLDRMGDREFVVQILTDARPFARPGRYLAYHAVSGGYILGEVVHQVTGKDIRQVLEEEILDPLGFEWSNYGVPEERIPEVAINYVTGPRTLPPLSTLLTRALGTPLDPLVEMTNDPRFLTGIIPAANVITTANEHSRFYELMRRGGEMDGVRVLSPEAIHRALTEQSRLEIDLSLGFPTRFSYGLMLGARVLSLYGRDTDLAFGHLGFTNMLGWADPERALACAVLTNGKPIIYPELPRFFGLMQRITSEAPKADPSELLF
jgi:CubicO group peptidase (beta-lactamase class C family)